MQAGGGIIEIAFFDREKQKNTAFYKSDIMKMVSLFVLLFYIRLIEKQCDICGKEHLHSWYILENIRCVSLLLVYKNLTRGFLLI